LIVYDTIKIEHSKYIIVYTKIVHRKQKYNIMNKYPHNSTHAHVILYGEKTCIPHEQIIFTWKINK
jgi:hypothetical protein